MSITVPFPQDSSVVPTSDVELRINRRNTRAFIAADPVYLVMLRRVVVMTPGGGRKEEPSSALPAQKLRMIPANDRTPQIRTASGEYETPAFTVLGEFSANLQQGDRFVFDGIEYLVATKVRPKHTNRAYQRKADVVVNHGA